MAARLPAVNSKILHRVPSVVMEEPIEDSDDANPGPVMPSLQQVASFRMFRDGLKKAKRNKRHKLRFPPTIRSEMKGNHVFRFTGADAQETDVTVATLLKVCVAATGATAARPCFTSVRLRRISIWSPVPSIGATPTFAAIRYEGTNTDDSTWYDTSAVLDDMAHVSKAPPRNSIAAFWHHSDIADISLKLAFVSMAADSIVDLLIEWVMDDTSVNSAYTFTGGTGMTAGTLYYGKLGSYTQPGKAVF